jgi:hypothetical protein
MIRVEYATEEHAREIAPRLCLFGFCGERVDGATLEEIALHHVRHAAEAWAWIEDERVIAIAGVFDRCLLGGVAAAWLLPTSEAYRSPRAFWHASKAVIARLKQKYRRVEGHVDAEYHAAIRWLARLGFEVTPHTFSAKGRIYRPFVMEI